MIEQQSEINQQNASLHQFIATQLDPITIEYLLKMYDKQSLTPEFRKKYSKDLNIQIFRFKIENNNKEWEIRKKLSEFIEFGSLMKKKISQELPPIPQYKDNETSPPAIKSIQNALDSFMKKIILFPYDQDLLHFLEILPEKFGSGIIHAEVRLKKHSGGRHTEATCGGKFKSAFCCCCRNWRSRYFTITDHCLFYTMNKKSYQIKEMLSFTSNFKFYLGQKQTGSVFSIILESAYRNLELKASTIYDYTIFISALKESYNKSSYSKVQRYQSFAEVREDCYSKFYIDGENYFKDLCQTVSKAEKYVYITDWMLTPYFMLKRPSELDDRSSRLDYVLENAAQRGVKVHIILYMEPEIALNNDSRFVEKYLQDMHKNITVLRHPNYILIPFLWSHHEKIVIVDQKCAFLGGLDLCYGRWDTQKHSLSNQDELWKGADFCNFRISDIYQPRNFLSSNLGKQQPRMPWHDISIQIRGPSVIDVTRHFVQYWNFVSFQTRFNERQLLMHSGHGFQLQQRRTTFFSNLTLRQNLQKNEQNEKIEEQEEEKEYYEQFIEEDLSRFSIRMPNISLQDIKKYPKRIYNYIKEGEDSSQLQRLLLPLENKSVKKGQQIHQILRSASTWSLGLEQDSYEQSIYLAYQDIIKNAKQFIYIENQFFISKKNNICSLLAERILRAYRKKQKFKVIIMMPLLPGFEGDIMDENSAVMRVQLNWEYVTILRSKFSLFARIGQIPNPSDYVQVLSLRNHAKLSTTPVTEIVYIHSKLLIVDDCKLIVGSANINDRSLLGNRDSEIGIIVEDKDLIYTGQNRLVSQSIHKLRTQLYQQHFSISSNEAEDYLNQQIWGLIRDRAKKNTILYRQIFGCYPDNMMKTYKDIGEFKKSADLQKYDSNKDQIVGFVVEWPMRFLEGEDLSLKPSQKQFFVPQMNFT